MVTTKVCLIHLIVTMASMSLTAGLEYKIYEGQPIGTPIGNVADDSGLGGGQDELGGLKFNLLPHGYPHTHLFSVELTTSVLRTAKDIDREELCGNIIPCSLDIVVGILSDSGNFFQIVPVKVIINDINDNAPIFSEKVLQVSIPESATPGFPFNIPTATDRDIGNNTVQTYRLLTPSDLFTLRMIRKPEQSIDISLILNRRVDREEAGFYQLQILSEDGGAPPKTGTAMINVTITDVNDHTPEFTKTKYTVSHSENATIGKTLLRIEAKDSDVGNNGRVTYYFGLHTNKDVLEVLSINETSGAITLRNSLDYETKKQYQFIVGATDHGSQPQTTETTVVINVEDVNDKTPSLHFNLLSGGEFSVLSETSGLGSFIAHVSVSDRDSGINGQVTCYVTPTGFELHRLISNEYKVLLNRTLDREKVSEHVVTIVCQDGGVTPLEGSGQFTVKVSDANDNAPVFSPAQYMVEMEENNKQGEYVTKVSATDSDIAENSQILFSLASHHDLFDIDSSSGVITATGNLDRERFPDIELLVVATDKGSTPMSSTATVSVHLLDVNDMVPTFSEKYYNLYVSEEEIPGTLAGRVSAEDRDLGRNGKVMYTLLKNPAHDVPFVLNSFDGTLVTEKILDRETQSSYRFVIAARDDGQEEQLYSMVNVTIHVTDTNDHFPIFINPQSSDNTVDIYHTDYVGTLITHVKATDVDSGENATINFRIVSGNDKNLFQIHTTTGEVFVVNDMSMEDVGQYIIVLSASDQGKPPKQQSTELVINVHRGNATMTGVTVAKATTDEEPVVDMLIIGITIAVTTILLILIIMVTIILVRRSKSKRAAHAAQNHPRAESQHMMAYGDTGFGVNRPSQCTLPAGAAMPRPGDIQRHVNFSLASESSGAFTTSTCPNTTFTTFKGENSLSSIDHHSLQQPKACSSMITINPLSPGRTETILTRTSAQESATSRSTSPARSSLRGSTQSMSAWQDSNHNVTYTIIQAPNDALQRMDNHSDVSGETTASDSGRGGSEEETACTVINKATIETERPSLGAKAKKRVHLVDPVISEEANVHQRIKSWVASHEPQSAHYQINVDEHGNYPLPSDSAIHMLPHTRATKSPNYHKDYSTYIPTSILKNSPSHKSYQKTAPVWRANDDNVPEQNMNTVQMDPLSLTRLQANDFYRHSELQHASRHQLALPVDLESDIMTDSVRDDDGETTTSGSYVINADELCDEINELFFNDVPQALEI